MDGKTEKTVAVLKELIASMEGGTMRVLELKGNGEDDLAELTIVMKGRMPPPQAKRIIASVAWDRVRVDW